MKYPEDYINKVICGDCLELIQEIPDNGVDFTFTSPPFKGENETDKRRKYNGDVKGNYWDWYDKFMETILRITKDYALIFNSSRRMIEIIKRYREKRSL